MCSLAKIDCKGAHYFYNLTKVQVRCQSFAFARWKNISLQDDNDLLRTLPLMQFCFHTTIIEK